MPLDSGARFGPYEVHALVGAGGMGEVYEATDTDLKRSVALKVLPASLANEPGYLIRFRREAELLAALNHPNIAQIYGFERDGDTTAIVMELVGGVTLAERVARGPVPLTEALAIARQVASALDAAHERGIVHRDLKPGNVKVDDEGVVKVLDFGLAKAVDDVPLSADVAGVSTITSPAMTAIGMILGTAPYMSPEQARGKPVDKRTDIWAFGALLYEMLTGRRAFAGDDVTETIGAVIHKEPDWSALPAHTPAFVHQLLRRCLIKDRTSRFRDIGDVRLELDEARSSADSTAGTATGEPRRPLLLRWSVLAVVAIGCIGLGYLMAERARPSPASGIKRFLVDFGNAPLRGSSLALSPDGRMMAYSSGSYEASQLFVRQLDQPEARVLRGTIGAANPFFSPDGEFVAFSTLNGLRKAPVGGGPVVPLTTSTRNTGSGSWGRDGTIVFSDSNTLWRVQDSGGPPEAISELDTSRGEIAHLWPEILPDGKSVIFTVRTSMGDDAYRIAVQRLDAKDHRVIVEGGAGAKYARTGHLVFVQSGALVSAPFDLDRLRIAGSTLEVPVGITKVSDMESFRFAFTSDGTLALVEPSVEARNVLVWIDRNGKTVRDPAAPPRAYRDPALSPDGRRLAVSVTQGAQRGLWLGQVDQSDLVSWLPTPSSLSVAWTPDGKRVAYAITPTPGTNQIVVQDIDGFRPPETLVTSERGVWPGSWTVDGTALAYMAITADKGGDILLMKPGSGTPQPLVSSPATEWGGRLSPDGRWIAFVSNTSGRWEAYLQPFPGPASPRRVSSNGGVEVQWARRGRDVELLYRNGRQMVSVPIGSGTGNVIPQPLFEGAYVLGSPGGHNYDVTPDGERFLMIKAVDQESPRRVHVVLNWFNALKRDASAH